MTVIPDAERAAAPAQWSDEHVGGWGMAVGGPARVVRPTTTEQIQEILSSASHHGHGLALRGAGCSYGDASTNTGGSVLDLTAMRRILAFDPVAGTATVQPGVTVRDLWRHAIRFGLWPSVVPGTGAVSVGGAAAMNIHGKNNYAVGSFGEHVISFALVTPAGDTLVCDRNRNADVFHAAIGGFGMLGCFTELTLRLKRVYSGRLRVTAIPNQSLEGALQLLEDMRGDADYLVGWIDLLAKGNGLGCGLMHRADQLEPGEDPAGICLLEPSLQDVPDRLFSVVPKSWLWPGMWLALNTGGVPMVNSLKYRAGFREARNSPHLQSHGAFHFLLDYVPRWHWMCRPGGLIQFQPFVPWAEGERVLRALIEKCHAAGQHPYLGVLKRHRPDPFLMTHAVDGYSLAMDFPVSKNAGKRAALWRLCQQMAEFVLESGGRFYYAKDAVLLGSSFPRIHDEDAVSSFRSIKARCDPAGVLQTDLSRRMGVA